MLKQLKILYVASKLDCDFNAIITFLIGIFFEKKLFGFCWCRSFRRQSQQLVIISPWNVSNSIKVPTSSFDKPSEVSISLVIIFRFEFGFQAASIALV